MMTTERVNPLWHPPSCKPTTGATHPPGQNHSLQVRKRQKKGARQAPHTSSDERKNEKRYMSVSMSPQAYVRTVFGILTPSSLAAGIRYGAVTAHSEPPDGIR